MNWILILTLINGPGTAITSVPGFATKDLCDQAAMAWVVKLPARYERFATCVLGGSK